VGVVVGWVGGGGGGHNPPPPNPQSPIPNPHYFKINNISYKNIF